MKEEIDRNRYKTKGYAFVTFSTTVFLYFVALPNNRMKGKDFSSPIRMSLLGKRILLHSLKTNLGIRITIWNIRWQKLKQIQSILMKWKEFVKPKMS
jgi:hypothetical protein